DLYAADRGRDLARSAALRSSLAGPVGDVGPARGGHVRGWPGGAALEDPPLVRLARHDQLLGLPAAPVGLQPLPLDPGAAPQAHYAGPGAVLRRAARGDHRAQRADL